MDSSAWLALCYRALDVGDDLPEHEQRRAAELALLARAGLQADVLGIGAAEVAIDLVIRYGLAGQLDELLLRWEQAEALGPEIATLGDEGTRQATRCAQRLVADVVALVEGAAAGDG